MATADKCCISGFQWDNGTPTGHETTLANMKTYMAQAPSTSSSESGGPGEGVAILFIHDAFGWTFVNERLLCDAYAQEVGATVYMPDL